MAKITIKHGGNLDRMLAEGADLEPLLDAIGVEMAAMTKMTFDRQGRGPVKWPPRSVPNIAGALKDVLSGKSPPKRRLDPTPALKDTGDLQRGIAHRVVGERSVEIGASPQTADYAQRQQDGTPEVIPLGNLRLLYAWFSKLDKAYKRKLGWIWAKKYRKTGIEFAPRPRPIFFYVPEDLDVITEIVTDFANGEL